MDKNQNTECRVVSLEEGLRATELRVNKLEEQLVVTLDVLQKLRSKNDVGKVTRLEEQLGVALDVAKLTRGAIERVRLASVEQNKVLKIQTGEIRALQTIVKEDRCLIADLMAELAETKEALELVAHTVGDMGDQREQISDLIANVHILQTHERANRKSVVVHEKYILKLVNLARERGARRVESL